MFKKLISIFIIFLGFLVIFLGIIFLSFNIFLPKKRLKYFIGLYARGYLFREARVKDISINPIAGLKIFGFEISDYPDFRSGEFLSVDEILVKINLMPLLNERLSISYVSITNPRLKILFKKDGSNNLSGLISNNFLSHIAPLSLFISRFDVNNASITISGIPVPKGIIEIKNLKLYSDNISISSPFKINSVFDISIDKQKDLFVSLNAISNLQTNSIEIENLQIKKSDSMLVLSGKIENILKDSNLLYNIKVEGDRKLFSDLTDFFLPNINFLNSSKKRINLSLSGTGNKINDIKIKYLP